jgi:hypothetical protein
MLIRNQDGLDPLLLRVEVVAQSRGSASHYVVLSVQNLKCVPYRIENRCAADLFRYAQQHVNKVRVFWLHRCLWTADHTCC